MGKVALVHDFLNSYTGAERVLKALSDLYPDAPIYTLFYDPKITGKYFKGCTIIPSSLQRSLLRRKPALLVNKMPNAIEEWDFKDYDIVISSSGAFSHGIVTLDKTKHFCYYHAPMRYAWDWHAEYLNEKGINNPILRLFAESGIHKLRSWDYITSKRVDVWIANSQNVANRIKRYYRQDNSHVIYPPIPVKSIIEKSANSFSNTTEKYAITISRLTPNKRINLIIEACANLRLPLVVIGEGAAKKQLSALAKELKANLTFKGWVSEEEKINLLSKSSLFVFAAEDDFGITPIEAMACGIPVVALNAGGTAETVIDQHNGIHYSEPSAKLIAEAIQKALDTKWDRNEIQKSALKYDISTFNTQILELVGKKQNG